MWNLKKKKKIQNSVDTENRLAVARGGAWVVSKIGEGGQEVQTSSYRTSLGDVKCSMGDSR